ncbi:hypothetical protein MH215_03585 [Paenibacillus sp. ACRSA]|uniref:hypothetical protein n=1 Tax=Paenibacillus sp. ACRSA TaxID=2918211 RepID=UPI001EF4855A|nr:hypothetical protein [Paenibacillus sp. ACRSA]MCG7376059.1 hypothetical protein [Paenibacillus sp. ACRSA]
MSNSLDEIKNEIQTAIMNEEILDGLEIAEIDLSFNATFDEGVKVEVEKLL